MIESGVEAVQKVAPAESRSDNRSLRESVSKPQAWREVVVSRPHVRVLRDVTQAGENEITGFEIEIDVTAGLSRHDRLEVFPANAVIGG